MQKCLDKDPQKRWSCERLVTHAYFEDYVIMEKEMEAAAETININKHREKPKLSNTSLPQLPATQESRVPQKNTYLRSDHHLPTI